MIWPGDVHLRITLNDLTTPKHSLCYWFTIRTVAFMKEIYGLNKCIASHN